MFSTYLAQHGTRTAPADRVVDLFSTLLHHADDEQPPALDAETLLADDLSTFALPADEEPAA
jgi:exonuclease SbcD